MLIIRNIRWINQLAYGKKQMFKTGPRVFSQVYEESCAGETVCAYERKTAMTAIDYSRSDPYAHTRPTFVNRVTIWIADSFRTWKNRRDFYRLGELTDVELQDIGLVRSDLFVPVDLSFTHDPTVHLNRVARQRIARMEMGAW